ncbi:tetratricopeptide repeat protein [bacterium]|nr:tetratricopeptide repeat protein [bacterium]
MNSEQQNSPGGSSPLYEAEVKLREGDTERARLLASEHSGPAAQVFLARLAGRVGDPTLAEKHYRLALEQDSGNLPALRALSTMAMAGGRNDEARTLLGRWAAADPDDPEHEDMLGELDSPDDLPMADTATLPVSEELEEVLTRPEPQQAAKLEILEGELMPAPSLAEPDLWDLGDEAAQGPSKEDV